MHPTLPTTTAFAPFMGFITRRACALSSLLAAFLCLAPTLAPLGPPLHAESEDAEDQPLSTSLALPLVLLGCLLLLEPARTSAATSHTCFLVPPPAGSSGTA